MKIRTEQDVELLDARIKQELKVDVRKYKNEEVIEKFVSLLVFPEYVLTWMIGPILVALVIYVLGFFFLQLVHIEYVLYGLIALVLFSLLGICAGLLLLTSKMKRDIAEVVDYSQSRLQKGSLRTSIPRHHSYCNYPDDH